MLIRKLALGAVFALCAASANAQSFGAPAAAPAATQAPAGAHAVDIAPKVSLDVTKLRRMSDKGVLQLEFTVTNRSDLAITLRDLGLGDNFKLTGINLVDFTNKRKYAMGTANGICLCTNFGSVDGGLVKPGEAKTFWAWFALPQTEVADMAVLLADRSPILNVQLQ